MELHNTGLFLKIHQMINKGFKMNNFLLQKKGFSFLETLIAAMFFTLVAAGVFRIYAEQQQILERTEMQLTISEILRTVSDRVHVYQYIEINNVEDEQIIYESSSPDDLDNLIGTRSEERRVGKECRYRWAP